MSTLDETNQTGSAPSGIGQQVTLEFETAGGMMDVKLAYSSIQQSGLLRNLILDTGLDYATETIPVTGGGINKMMPDELDKFITCWRDYYPLKAGYSFLPEQKTHQLQISSSYNSLCSYSYNRRLEDTEIPANLDVATIHSQIDIPVNIAGLFKPGPDYAEYLARHKLLDVVGGSCLVNWDIRQLARFIKVSNFLDLPRMLELFKFVLAKCMLECKNC